MGVVPQGTFNYFARTHGIPAETVKATTALFAAALVTLLGSHRQLRLHIEHDSGARSVITPTLFVGNNRLQFEQVGLREAPTLDAGRIAAVMLRPIGPVAMLGLVWRGAMGTLGEADSVDSFEFRRMAVTQRVAGLCAIVQRRGA